MNNESLQKEEVHIAQIYVTGYEAEALRRRFPEAQSVSEAIHKLIQEGVSDVLIIK